MALVPYTLEIIRDLLPKIAKQKARTGNILTLSLPDIIATVAEVEGIFGKPVRGHLHVRPDSSHIIRWHKAKTITREIVDTRKLFEVLGYRLHAMDLVKGRGDEIIHNMNDPLPKSLAWMLGNYDLVFDCITNQCFNVAQAMATALRVCRPAGYILHVTPVTQVNQGFYGVSPTTYYDFYEANGCTIEIFRTIVGNYRKEAEIELHRSHRCRQVPDDAMNIALVKKAKHPKEEVVWPIMKKFQTHPTCLLTPDDNRSQE